MSMWVRWGVDHGKTTLTTADGANIMLADPPRLKKALEEYDKVGSFNDLSEKYKSDLVIHDADFLRMLGGQNNHVVRVYDKNRINGRPIALLAVDSRNQNHARLFVPENLNGLGFADVYDSEYVKRMLESKNLKQYVIPIYSESKQGQ